MIGSDKAADTNDSNGRGRSAVVFRTGALGDFILCVPFVRTLTAYYDVITLITHPAYQQLTGREETSWTFLDCNSAAFAPLYAGEGVKSLFRNVFKGADVYMFSRYDAELEKGLTNSGANYIYWLDPRPQVPPHVVDHFHKAAELSSPAEEDLSVPLWPRKKKVRTPCLWLHPGSGGREKVVPFSVFFRMTLAWQKVHPTGRIMVSFGPADEWLRPAVCEELQQAGLSFTALTSPRLSMLKERLQDQPTLFVGNDCGVAHLAAAAGVPSVVMFKNTDPAVWHPMGPCITLPQRTLYGEWLRPYIRIFREFNSLETGRKWELLLF